MSEVIKSHQRTGVQLLLGDDGFYQVLADGECVFSSRVLAAAEVFYEEERDVRNADVLAVRERERQHYEMQAVRSESFERRAANAAKKGGRGGRGGV